MYPWESKEVFCSCIGKLERFVVTAGEMALNRYALLIRAGDSKPLVKAWRFSKYASAGVFTHNLNLPRKWLPLKWKRKALGLRRDQRCHCKSVTPMSWRGLWGSLLRVRCADPKIYGYPGEKGVFSAEHLTATTLWKLSGQLRHNPSKKRKSS